MKRSSRPGPTNEATPFSRLAPSRIVPIAFLILAAASLFLLVHPWYDMTNDASVYIILARSMLAGDGYSLLGVPFTIRPPLFPLMIAPWIDRFGLNFAVLNGFVALFGLAAVVLFYFYLRPRLGWVPALLVAAALWFNPGFRAASNTVMSDVPSLAFLLLCLLAERRARRSPSTGGEVLLGVSVAAATYLRTVNILLVPAIVLSRWTARRTDRRPEGPWSRFSLRRAAGFALIVFLMLLPWMIRNRVVQTSEDRNLLSFHSYWTAMWHVDRADPDSETLPVSQAFDRIPRRLERTAFALGSRMRPDAGGPTTGRTIFGGILVLCSLIALVRRRGAGEFYLLFNLIVLSVYFGFGTRLVLPIFVLALPATYEVLDGLRRAVGDGRWLRPIVPAAVVLLIAIDFHPHEGWEKIRSRHVGFEDSCRAIQDELEPNARIGSLNAPRHLQVFLNRPVYPLSFAVRDSRSYLGACDVIDEHDLDTILFPPTPTAKNDLGRVFRNFLVKRYDVLDPDPSSPVLRIR